MANSKNLRMSTGLLLIIYLSSFLIDLTNCETDPRLEILPVQEIQRKPVGKSLMLTCRPIVQNAKLISDMQWHDNNNITIPPKQKKYYYPLYDSKGRRLPATAGQSTPPMYTELLPGDNLALLISSLTETMAGRYYCSASYTNTRLVTSVQVETYVAITWLDAPQNQFPILGADYSVKCRVTATPPPTVDWLRNGDPIKTGGKYIVETHGLLIREVQESDDGIYTCRASVMQTGELVERSIRVEVYIKPVITYLPDVLEAVEKSPFSAYCNATGKPIPAITWIKDLTQQSLENADRFSVFPQTGLMTISDVNRDDHGNYTCIARNAAGRVEKQTKLNVLVIPKIDELYNSTSAEQKEIALTCRSKGRPAPEITYRRWGTEEDYVAGPQPDDNRVVLEQHFDEERGESTGTLRISKLIREDDGLYQCIARNRGGADYKTGHITVEFAPNFDHMKDLPPVFSWEERKANLSCLAMGMPNATIEWRWNGRLIKERLDKNLEIIGNGPRSDLIVTPVGGRTYYSVYKCIASNIHGTTEIDMQLKEGKVPEYIPAARAKVVTATTMTFEITSPPTERGLPILAYSVQYKEEINLDWSRSLNRSWSPDSPYVVEGLKPQTRYVFRFAARNQVGLGPWGANTEQSTPKRSAPEEPKTLHSAVNDDEEEPIVVSPYSDHFELRWNIPADNGEPIDFYQVKYCPGMKMNGIWNEIENECISREVIETSAFQMSHLTGNTYYRIELRAHNSIGFSTPASIYMKTARGNDVVTKARERALSSASIVGIAIGGVIILLIIIDFMFCVFMRMGVMASMCRKTKRSPSEIDEEQKLGSLYGWRFPLPYCSGQLVKEPPPSPLPLPPPVKLGGSPMASPLDEKEPLNTPPGSIKKHSSVEFDGRFVHSRSGDIIGKNSAV